MIQAFAFLLTVDAMFPGISSTKYFNEFYFLVT